MFVRFFSRPASRRPFALSTVLLLFANVLLAPAVQAATGEALARPQAYALSLLGLVVVALAAYLFVVMFQPERF